jgi:hypothetical protein
MTIPDIAPPLNDAEGEEGRGGMRRKREEEKVVRRNAVVRKDIRLKGEGKRSEEMKSKERVTRQSGFGDKNKECGDRQAWSETR